MTVIEDYIFMVTDKQLEANRENAQHSTGPRPEAGKERAKLNAWRHGLTGQSCIVPEEDRESFNLFTTKLSADFDPANFMEAQLAHLYATFQWRIHRAAAIEATMLTLGQMEGIADNPNIEPPQAHTAATNARTSRSEISDFCRLPMDPQHLVT